MHHAILYSELLIRKDFTFPVSKDLTFNRNTQPNKTRISMQKGGSDSDGREFKSAEEMWREQVGEDQSKKTDWYREGVGYWEVSALLVNDFSHWLFCILFLCHFVEQVVGIGKVFEFFFVSGEKRVWRLRQMESWEDLGI